MMVDAAQRRATGRAGHATNPAATFGYDLIRLPVSEVQIGSWHLASKHPEHIQLVVSGGERKMRLEVMQVGAVRRLELGFDDLAALIVGAENGYEGADGKRLLVQCLQPPRFLKQAPHGGAGAPVGKGGITAQPDYIHTADFTQGNASQIDTHVYRFAHGVLEPALPRLQAVGLAFDESERAVAEQLASVAAEAAAAAATRRPKAYIPRALNTTAVTASPRLQAVALMEQLEREMSDRQARYAGICPVRASIYEAVFTELLGIVRADEPKRGALLERVRAEAQMTIAAYSTVFEHSAEFGSRKLAAATELKGPLEAAIEELQAAIVALQAEADKAAALVETLEYRAAEEARRSEAKAKDVAELERSNAMLEQLLEVLKPSAPQKDKDAHAHK